LWVPDHVETLGPEVADLCGEAGFTPDGEQRLCLDAIFALDERGKSACFEVDLIACRQNLKTGALKCAAFGWLFVTEQRLIVWSAHEFAASREAFRDLVELIDGSDWARRRIKSVNRSHGDESIETIAGQRVLFKARTKGAGRALSGDKVVLDEGYALQPSHMGALLPTLSARPDPQVIVASSAGRPESDVLRDARDRGRAGGAVSQAYFEWCADDPETACRATDCDHARNRPGCACDDPAQWQKANPAMGRRIQQSTIAKERQSLPPGEFGRERMGWWDEPASSGDDKPIDYDVWQTLTDEDPDHAPAPGAFAVEIDRDRAWASIGMAGRRGDGMTHLEVVDRRRGERWVVARCAELRERHGNLQFVVDGGGPASTLIEPLTEAGLTVTTASFRDLAQACGQLVDAVNAGEVVHGPQPELEEAVNGARKRGQGDGGFTFGRQKSGGDVTPLLAVTLAMWALGDVYEISDSIF